MASESDCNRVMDILRWMAPGYLISWQHFVTMVGLEERTVQHALLLLSAEQKIRIETPSDNIRDGFRVWVNP